MRALKRCLGVDLGSSSVKLVEMSREKDAVRLLRFGSRDLALDPHATPEERSEAVAEAVRDLLRDLKITTKSAVFSVPGQAVFIKRVRLPRTSEERLHRIINFEARQQIPFPLDKTLLEYQVFDEPGSPDVEVLMVAIKRDFVDNFMRTVSRLRLKPVQVTVSTLAQFNFHLFNTAAEEMLGLVAAKGPPRKAAMARFSLPLGLGKKRAAPEEAQPTVEAPEDLEAIAGSDRPEAYVPEGEAEFDLGEMDLGVEDVKAYLHVGANTLDVVIARFGQRKSLGFTRSVPVAGNEITKMVMDRLKLESFKQAEQIKRTQCAVVSEEADLENIAPEADPEASAAASTVVNRLVAEIRRTLDFYVSQPDGVTVDSVVLSGGTAQLTNLGPYIEEKIGMLVEPSEGPTTERLIVEDGPPEGWDRYLPAIGMALTGLGLGKASIDFLPTNLKDLRQFKSKFLVIGTLSVLLLASVGVGMTMGKSDKDWYRSEIERMENDLERIAPYLARGQEAIRERETIRDQFGGIAPLMPWRTYWPEIYDKVILKWKPPQIYLTRVDLTAWGQIRIQGVASDDGAISDYERNISENAQEYIRTGEGDIEVKIQPQRTVSRTGQELINFEIYLRSQTKKDSQTVAFRDLWPRGPGQQVQQRRPSPWSRELRGPMGPRQSPELR